MKVVSMQIFGEDSGRKQVKIKFVDDYDNWVDGDGTPQEERHYGEISTTTIGIIRMDVLKLVQDAYPEFTLSDLAEYYSESSENDMLIDALDTARCYANNDDKYIYHELMLLIPNDEQLYLQAKDIARQLLK